VNGRHSLDDLRSNDFAGPAPGGKAVEDYQLVFSLLDGLVEVGLPVFAMCVSYCSFSKSIETAKLDPRVMAWTCSAVSESGNNSRLQVMYTGVHFARVVEESRGKYRSVEVEVR
jgi:hypothetical protein